MLKFTSKNDVARLNPSHPALPIIQELVQRIIIDSYKTEYPYSEDADGFIALIEPEDVDRPLTEIWGQDAYSLRDIPYEGIFKDESGEFFVCVFLANNEWGLTLIVPQSIVQGELLAYFEEHLDS